MHTLLRRFSAQRLAACRPILPLIALLLGIGGLAGCGGGSSSHTNNPPPGGTTRSLVSGTVTDINGAAIVGANVSFGSLTTTSSQFGTYTIPNVAVPSGQTSLVGIVQASAVVNGRNWTGQNMIEVLQNEPDTSNVHIVLSDAAAQGSLAGTVRDSQNRPLVGARVFAGIGPIVDPQNPTSQSFTNLSSFATTTDLNGNYTLPKLPPAGNYTVTASFAGYINQTVNNATVQTSATPTSLSFILNSPSGASSVPPVTGFAAIAITGPSVPTRAAGLPDGTMNAIRRFVMERKGWTRHRAVKTPLITRKKSVTRDTPAGSVIEADLFWDYAPLDNLFGYDILQATSLNPPNFISIALLRDPLGDRFSDVDLGLTPDTNYYYSVARLDTIHFPTGNTQQGESDPASPVAIQPLGPVSLKSPNSGTTVSGAPTFSWTAVNRATLYQVLVYDRFPTLQSDTDPNGVRPIWPADPANPGTSLVQAPTTSQVYQGPALVPGRTYYWAILAQDGAGSAFAVSPIQTFIAQ